VADARYGYAHRKLREAWRPCVHALSVTCWRCGELIVPDLTIRGEGWDLGHVDGGRPDEYAGPEHAGPCNRSSAASRGNRTRGAHIAARRWVL